MGMDITCWPEVREGSTWAYAPPFDTHAFDGADFPFGWRNYTMFAFLSDGSNSRVKDMPTGEWAYRGLPENSRYLNEIKFTGMMAYGGGKDVTRREWDMDDDNNHGFSWVALSELLAFDYDQMWQSPQGPETVREALGDLFFVHLDLLKAYGAPQDVRIVYYFN